MECETNELSNKHPFVSLRTLHNNNKDSLRAPILNTRDDQQMEEEEQEEEEEG